MEHVNDFIPAVNSHQDKHGYTLWAACLKDTEELMGFIGLNYTTFESDFTPAVEVGWRLGSQYWGKWYATEGAKASLEYGFKKFCLKEIVSFTVPANVRSLRVMEKIGLKRDLNGDFAHPKLPDDHKLSHHFLYRLSAADYNNQGAETAFHPLIYLIFSISHIHRYSGFRSLKSEGLKSTNPLKPR